MKKIFLLPALASGLCAPVSAQTNPTAQTLPYSQNFGTGTFTSLPAGTAAWTVSVSPSGSQATAESNTNNGNSTVSAATAAQTAGGCYGYATSSNGRFYIQTDNNIATGSDQLACAINTLGWTSVQISYDIEMISPMVESTGIVLQYRVGTSGSWTTISGSVYLHSTSDRTTGAVDNFTSLSIPSAANNNAVVQLRWATWKTSGTKFGKSSGIAIDNISVTATPQTNGYFRSKKTGDWNDVNTWQASADNVTWVNAVMTPKYTANTVTIRSAHTVTLTATDTIDQVVVEGTLIYADISGSTPRINNGTGVDLLINGRFADLGPNAVAWAGSATWSMGNHGGILRTRSTSADGWRDNYDGGISTIPAGAYWVISKTGSDDPEVISGGGMYYPNLSIENNTGSIWTTAAASSFTGSSAPPVIKGDLDIGGAGSGVVSFLNDNTNASAVLVKGDLAVQSGSTLRSQGTGFELQGSILLDGTIDYGGSNATFIFSGSNNQNIYAAGTIPFNNVQLNKASTSATVTLQNPATVAGTFTFTSGYLNTTATNILTFDNGSAVAAANDSSFVEGPVEKIGNAAFIFPTGKGNNYQPVSISAPSNAGADYTAEYFHADPALGSAKDGTLDSISNCEYWNLNNVGTAYPVYVTLGWNSNSCLVPVGATRMKVTEWNGTRWLDLRNTSTVPGTATSLNKIETFGTFTAASAGGWHSLFVCSTGGVYQSGWNFGGSTPDLVPGTSSVIAVSAGGASHNLALLSGGTVIAWGDNGYGELGNGTTTNSYTTPVAVSGLTNIIAVSAGDGHSLALKNDGTVWAWGNNNSGQLGNGSFDIYDHPVAAQVLGLPPDITAISAGTLHSLALTSGGEVWVWGDNFFGQIGINSTGTIQLLPVQEANGYTDIVAISAGEGNSIILNSSGNVFATGFNGGQSGNGSWASSQVFIPSTSLPSGITAISAGGNMTVVLRNDGTVWACGSNSWGELGNGTNIINLLVTQVVGLTCIKSVEAGWFHTIAIDNNGAAFGWGYNHDGELGDGTTIDRNTPVSITLSCPLAVPDLTITGTGTVCSGTGSSLTASLGSSPYTWAGAGLSSTSGITVIATPTTTTTYTVTDACSNTATYTVNVIPSPAVTVNSPTICAGDAATLTATASGAPTYTWSAGATPTGSNTADAYPAASTTYTVTGTAVNGCTGTAVATVTVNPLPASPIITGDPACEDLANTYTITNYNGSNSYFIGLLPLPSPGTVGSLNTGTGTFPVTWNSPGGGAILVTVTDANGCSNFGQLDADADNCVCSGTNIATTTWTNPFGLASGTLHALNSNVSVTGTNVVISNAAINIAPGLSIYVAPNAKLTLDHCHLYACTDMWQGIVVDDGGELEIIGGTMIEDAFIAADIPNSTGTSAILSVNGAIFNKNRTGIRIKDYQQITVPYPFAINDAVFTCRTMVYNVTTWATTAAFKTMVNSGAIDEHYAVGDLSDNFMVAPYYGEKSLEGINLDNTGILSGATFYDVQIGSSNSNTEMNVFDNLLFGVNATNSNFTCYNNAFQYILKASVPSPSGIGVNAVSNILYNTNNRIRVMSNVAGGHAPNFFYDCTQGVNTDRYNDITISDCDMRATGAPVYPAPLPDQGEVGIYIKTPNCRRITVDNNTITNVQNGIVFFGDDANSVTISSTTYSDAQDIGPVDITNNMIQATLGGATPVNEYAYIGIIAVNLMNYSGSSVYFPPTHLPYYMNVSSNHLHDVHNGIGLYNWFNFGFTPTSVIGNTPVSSDNFVSLRRIIYPNTTAQAQYGITHTLNWNAQVVQNNVIGFGNTDDRWIGLNIVDNVGSPGQSITCNHAENTGTGIQFIGIQTGGTNFFNNTMESSGKGFVLDNAAIGDQGDPGYASMNLWPAGTYSSGQYKTFTKNVSLGVTDPLRSLLYIGAASADQDPEFGGTSFNSNDLLSSTSIYSSSPSNGLIQTGSNSNSRSCTVPSSIVLYGGSGARSMEANDGKVHLLEQMVTNSIEYNYFETEQHVNDKFRVYRMLGLQPSLKNNSGILQNFYSAAQTGNIGKLADAEGALAGGLLAEAETLINGISPENAIETNYQNYYTAYLHYKNNTYNSSDSSALKELANGCPVRDGMEVYQARNLYSLIYTNFTVYSDDCVDQNARKVNISAVKEKEPDQGIEIFPNPNSGNFNVFISGEKIIDEPVEISISDLRGKVISTSIMQLKNNSTIFDMSLTNGVYIVSVKDSRGFIGKPKKITVIR